MAQWNIIKRVVIFVALAETTALMALVMEDKDKVLRLPLGRMLALRQIIHAISPQISQDFGRLFITLVGLLQTQCHSSNKAFI
jgi:hypothetical protein